MAEIPFWGGMEAYSWSQKYGVTITILSVKHNPHVAVVALANFQQQQERMDICWVQL